MIDRTTETLEHIQNIGSGCVASSKYYIQDGVESLLDDIDAERLFGEVEGNPDDVFDDPLETKDYTITIDFRKGSQHIIQGTYDKKSIADGMGRLYRLCMGFYAILWLWGNTRSIRIHKGEAS